MVIDDGINLHYGGYVARLGFCRGVDDPVGDINYQVYQSGWSCHVTIQAGQDGRWWFHAPDDHRVLAAVMEFTRYLNEEA